MARALALAAAVAVSLLLVSGAGGASAQTPKRGGSLQHVVLAAHRTTLRSVVFTPVYHLAGAEDWWLAEPR